MTLRNQTPLTLKPMGVTDTVDGTNGQAGSMVSLQNLVPSMHTRNVFVPRPAATLIMDTAPGEALVEIGDRLYGFFAGVTGASPQLPRWGSAIWGKSPWDAPPDMFLGRSVPFCYDFSTGGFVHIEGLSSANLPVPAPVTGDWTPPTITRMGGYVLFSHPGFALPHAFGWLDMTSLRDTATGDSGFNVVPAVWGIGIWGHATWSVKQATGGTVIANLSKNALLAGWRPGMIVSDQAGRIPADTRIVNVAPDGSAITLSNPVTAVTGLDLTVRGGTPDIPLWSSGNMAVTPLVDVPTAITLFNGRAYYAVKNAAVFSQSGDPLISPPTTINNALTIQNGLDITAMTTQPFNNSTVAGGIVQALLVWQADSAIWQITGDAAFGTLALNYLSSLGTLAPLAIQTSPVGTVYVAPDGVRVIQLDGTVGEPIGANGDGVSLPFINAIYPSRMSAAYNEDVYRVSVTYDTSVGGSVIATTVSSEFWFHIKIKAWSGPHTFPASLITASDRKATNHGYVMFPLNATGLWFSNSRPVINAGYVENGQQLSWVYRTTLFPDTGAMFQNAMLETAIMVSQPPTGVITVTAFDEASSEIDKVLVSGFTPVNAPPTTPAAIWGTAVWGTAIWGIGTAGALMAQRPVNWHATLSFKQASLQLTGDSASAVALGNVYLRYQRTGYMLQDLALAS